MYTVGRTEVLLLVLPDNNKIWFTVAARRFPAPISSSRKLNMVASNGFRQARANGPRLVPADSRQTTGRQPADNRPQSADNRQTGARSRQTGGAAKDTA